MGLGDKLKNSTIQKWKDVSEKATEVQKKYETIEQLNQIADQSSIEEAKGDSAKIQAEIEASNIELDKLKNKLKEYDKVYDAQIKTAHEDVLKRIDQLEKEKQIAEEIEDQEQSNTTIKDKTVELEAKKQKIEKINKKYEEVEKKIGELNTDLDKGSEALSKASELAEKLDSGYDKLVKKGAKFLTKNESTAFLEALAKNKFGEQLYNSASAIKNGASEAISGVNDLMSLKSTFGGSWHDPETAIKKVKTGISTIQEGVGKITNVANDVFSAVKVRESVILNKLDLPNNAGIIAMGSIATSAICGIGSFNALKSGNFKGAFEQAKDVYTSIRHAGSVIKNRNIDEEIDKFEDDKRQKAMESLSKDEDNKPEQIDNKPESEPNPYISDTENIGNSADNKKPPVPQSSVPKGDDDYGADMIHEINVILDGSSSSQNSVCTINGENYKLSGYSLSQELLQPMILSFSIEKDNKIETQSDVVFADSTQLIGKSFEINVSTNKTSQDDDKVTPRKAFVFKGMVIDVSASRATASTQSASVMVASWDALLQNAPHCRSFENMTLNEIISSILQPYGEIQPLINPRFKEKIPYIVQYNQSDYSFISMLAIRFGEWMYSTGEKFVFGELDEENASSANLEYPGGSLMSYNLHQNITPFSFNHLLSDYYQFGQDKAVVKESGKNIADGTVNTWTDKVYNASQQHFKNEQITTLSSGGFDNGKDEEGADTILGYSLNIESQGKKTGLMTVQGTSKLAMLKIGQTFLIRDNVQNKSGESKDVEQKALKIIGINHSFDYRQEYGNSFTAIPVACNYPSYSNADIFPTAPQQRAKVVENKDEQKLGRIRVQFPWQEIQSKEMKTPWLRIAVPYAGASKGQQFVPEIGEEVMVGFEMNNAERPYIIGSFYNGGNGKPDESWAVSKEESNTSNNIKAIRTRNGHTILFNDKGDAGLMEIYDNKGNTYHITLSADDKKITVYSAGEIEVIADSNINVRAKGDISINADGDIGIKSKGNISMEASKEVSIQASKVKVR